MDMRTTETAVYQKYKKDPPSAGLFCCPGMIDSLTVLTAVSKFPIKNFPIRTMGTAKFFFYLFSQSSMMVVMIQERRS